MNLKILCDISRNMKIADFYLIRVHSEDKVGKPVVGTYEDNKENIGVRVKDGIRDSSLDPKFLYYWFEANYRKIPKYNSDGRWHIRVEDVRDIPIA
jgi:restriction endonuclease S subunit